MEIKLYVTYCCKNKNETLNLATPRKMYQSPRIKCFFREFPEPRGILSYKYGIMFEKEHYKNYDWNKFSEGKHYKAIIYITSRKLEINGIKEIVLYSPRKLTELPWVKFLNALGLPYQINRSYKELSSKR